MNPELIAAVKERLELGHSDESIKAELRSAGYTDEMVEQVLVQVKGGTVPEPVTAGEESLPGVMQLLKGAFASARQRVDLMLLIAVPQIAVFLGGYFLEYSSPQSIEAGLAAGVLVLVGVVASIIVALAIIKVITSEQEESIGHAVAWATSNIFPFLWVSILTVLIVYGGMVLFVVPGIILSVLLAFSQVVFVAEGRRGLDALLRSRQLVLGRWWGIFGRLLGFGLLLYIVVLIPFAILVVLLGEGSLLAELLYQVINAVLAVVMLFGMYTLYKARAQQQPTTAFVPTEARTKYKLLAALGLLLPIIGIGVAVSLASLNDIQMQDMQSLEHMTDEELKERAQELRLE
ncbi:hypothetical protein H6778_02790 [Candidatus Nomurabacteria bacterium]|nr:hypothetical protein [Candidatus Nomurabacteria bacterium]